MYASAVRPLEGGIKFKLESIVTHVPQPQFGQEFVCVRLGGTPARVNTYSCAYQSECTSSTEHIPSEISKVEPQDVTPQSEPQDVLVNQLTGFPNEISEEADCMKGTYSQEEASQSSRSNKGESEAETWKLFSDPTKHYHFDKTETSSERTELHSPLQIMQRESTLSLSMPEASVNSTKERKNSDNDSIPTVYVDSEARAVVSDVKSEVPKNELRLEVETDTANTVSLHTSNKAHEKEPDSNSIQCSATVTLQFSDVATSLGDENPTLKTTLPGNNEEQSTGSLLTGSNNEEHLKIKTLPDMEPVAKSVSKDTQCQTTKSVLPEPSTEDRNKKELSKSKSEEYLKTKSQKAKSASEDAQSQTRKTIPPETDTENRTENVLSESNSEEHLKTKSHPSTEPEAETVSEDAQCQTTKTVLPEPRTKESTKKEVSKSNSGEYLKTESAEAKLISEDTQCQTRRTTWPDTETADSADNVLFESNSEEHLKSEFHPNTEPEAKSVSQETQCQIRKTNPPETHTKDSTENVLFESNGEEYLKTEAHPSTKPEAESVSEDAQCQSTKTVLPEPSTEESTKKELSKSNSGEYLKTESPEAKLVSEDAQCQTRQKTWPETDTKDSTDNVLSESNSEEHLKTEFYPNTEPEAKSVSQGTQCQTRRTTWPESDAEGSTDNVLSESNSEEHMKTESRPSTEPEAESVSEDAQCQTSRTMQPETDTKDNTENVLSESNNEEYLKGEYHPSTEQEVKSTSEVDTESQSESELARDDLDMESKTDGEESQHEGDDNTETLVEFNVDRIISRASEHQIMFVKEGTRRDTLSSQFRQSLVNQAIFGNVMSNPQFLEMLTSTFDFDETRFHPSLLACHLIKTAIVLRKIVEFYYRRGIEHKLM